MDDHARASDEFCVAGPSHSVRARQVLDEKEDSPVRESVSSLLARARSLRAQVKYVNPVLGEAYRRRAAELSLEGWVRAVRSAPLEIDDVISSVAA